MPGKLRTAGAGRFDEDQTRTSLFLLLDPGHGKGAAAPCACLSWANAPGAASRMATTAITSIFMILILSFALARVFGIRHVAAVALKEQHLIRIGARTFHAG